MIEEIITDAKRVWARRGKKLKRMYRCTSGRRKGRVVANPSQCFMPIDIGKRMQLKKTKAKMGPRLARKASRTKRHNPLSRRLRTLNPRR